MTENSIQSKLLPLNEIKGQYIVPAYQRLYTWDREQVRTLMEDLLTSFCKHRADNYYLGTILVSAANEELDLIDGQQRFTTLTLLAKELELSLSFELDFASRENLLEDLETLNQEADASKASNPGVIKLRDAQKEIKDQLDKPSEEGTQPVDKKDFAVYLASNVQLVQIQVPKGMDLNQLFEVINNRGMQLEQHQLLKGRLLHFLDDNEKAFLNDNEKAFYGEIWEACAQMDQYLERVPGKRFKAAPGGSLGFLSEAALDPVTSDEEATTRSLSRILQEEPGEMLSKDEESHTQANGTPVQSIMGFPLFLLHVLRIFNIKRKREDIPSLQDKNLIKIFDESWLKGLEGKDAKTEVIEFIKLLAQIRWLFDGQVIKWVGEGQERELMLRKLERSKDSITRDSEDSKPELSLLQAMLYHTQPLTAQQWLTPYLYFLHQQPRSTDTADLTVKATRYLQWLDNTLFCGQVAGETLLERTRALMEGSRPASDEAEKQFQRVKSWLVESKGTGFHHYWFYKVEYLLYYLARLPENSISQKIPDNKDWYLAIEGLKAEGYRMTSHNSIEHLFPQSEKHKLEGEDKDKVLDSFGNLALVSSSFNSGLSNKNVLEKKAYFEKHRQRNLKLELMLSQVDERDDIGWEKRWNADQIKEHQKTLLTCFQAYLRLTRDEHG